MDVQRKKGLLDVCVLAVLQRGRTRKYYQTTEAGRARIGTFLGEWEEVKQIYAFVKGTAAADGASFAAADTAPGAAADKTPDAAAGKTPGAAADTAPGAAANETSAAQMCMKGGPNGCEEEGMEEAHE